MWRNLKIKWKLGISFVLIVIFPMMITLYLMSNLMKEVMTRHQQKEVESAENYVMNVIDQYKTKSLNYIKLFTRDKTIAGRAENAILFGDPIGLVDELKEIYSVLDVDALIVCDEKGKILACTHGAEDFSKSKASDPIIKAALNGRILQQLSQDKEGEFAVRTAGPILRQNLSQDTKDKSKEMSGILGAIVVSIYLDDQFVENLKRLSHAEITLIHSGKVIATTVENMENERIDKAIIDEVQRTNESLHKRLDIKGDSYDVSYIPLQGDMENTSTILMVGVSRKELIDSQKRVIRTLLILTLIGGFLTAIVAYLLAQSIVKPLNALTFNANKIAREGDLFQEIEINSRDESGELASAFKEMQSNLCQLSDQATKIANGDLSQRIKLRGYLADSFNRMLDNLVTILTQVRDAGLHISSASSEILAASEQQSSSATEQAAAVNQTTAAMEELSATSKKIADNSNSVVQATEEAVDTVRAGQESVNNLTLGMDEIKIATEQSAKRILALGEKSQKIGDVVKIINDIADDTNLLALNAAIEAARAGEAGKGFGVVASEVRNLAENVMESTKEISDLVTEIQASINASLMATEEGTKKVQRGVKLSHETGSVLKEILTVVKATADSARQISDSTSQQMSASNQVLEAMKEISDGSRQSANAAKQTTSAVVNLTQLADELKETLKKFKLNHRVNIDSNRIADI